VYCSLLACSIQSTTLTSGVLRFIIRELRMKPYEQRRVESKQSSA
jgi:hypothetical protein